jgi:Protein of unknown function (DUF2865)
MQQARPFPPFAIRLFTINPIGGCAAPARELGSGPRRGRGNHSGGAALVAVGVVARADAGRKPMLRSSGLAVTLLMGLAGAVAAQSNIEELFGGRPPAARAELPARSYADPGRDSTDPLSFFHSQQPRMSAPSSGGGTAYCVRLCDGRYFPLQRHGDMPPADLCNAFCPASRTKVFFGGDIDASRAHDGTRYSALPNAFVYRERLLADCTCNGRTSYGLAALDAARDPTLRPGDIIATKDGLLTFRGTRSRRGNDTADFTPLDRSRMGRGLSERLGRVAVVGGDSNRASGE